MIDCIIIGPNENDFDTIVQKAKKQPNSIRNLDMTANTIAWEGKQYTCHDFMGLMLEKKFPLKYAKPDLYDTANMAVFLLANYLRQRSLNVEYINNFKSQKDKLRELLKGQVLTVAITTTFYSYKEPLFEVVKFIRKINKKVKIIIGGPMVKTVFATYADKLVEPSTLKDKLVLPLVSLFVFKALGVDYFIIEEQGEKTLYDLILAIKNKGDISKVANLWFRFRGKTIFTDKQKENNDINDNIIDWREFKEDMPKSVVVRTSSGCCFRCAFCSFRSAQFQQKTLESLQKEFDSLYELGIKHLIFVDDTFNWPTERFKKILELMIAKNYSFEWTSFLRCTDMDEEIYKLMKESGCKGVSIGVESFNEQVLKNMNKTNINYQKCIGYLNKYDILSFANFIVGFPGETKESVQETIEKFNQNPSTFFCPLVFGNHPDSYVARQRDKYGLSDNLFRWSHDTMNYLEAHELKNRMILDVENSFFSSYYGGNASSVPHLLSLGLSLDLVKKLYAATGSVIKANLKGENVDEEQIMAMLN